MQKYCFNDVKFLMEIPTQKKEHSLEKWEQLETSKGFGGLGFRNIETFNNAMLSKQLWRVLKVLDSLVAWIFKHKYFLNGQLLDAKIGYKPSFLWKSLCDSLDLQKKVYSGGWTMANGTMP